MFDNTQMLGRRYQPDVRSRATASPQFDVSLDPTLTSLHLFAEQLPRCFLLSYAGEDTTGAQPPA